MKNKSFLFSVVIPVYNVELYLRETLESIINQTIGIKNIQIILVNDGSTDGSESICKEYLKKYPENIEYYYQKNAGVSAARNNGLKKVKGQYTEFLDSDDKLSLNAFSVALKFFQKYKDVNILAFQIKHFDKISSYHYLNYRFSKERIVDLLKDENYIQTRIGNVVFKSSILKGHTFDKRLKYGEDGKFVNDIIFENGLKYGVTNKAREYYRKRQDESSAVQTKGKSTVFYSTICPLFYNYFIDKSIKKYGKVLKYYQYLYLNDIMFALKIQPHQDIDSKIVEKFYDDVKKIILNTDEDVINNIFDSNYLHKILSLKIKFNNIFDEDKISSYLYNSTDILEFDNDNLVIEGHIPNLGNGELFYSINNEFYKINTFERYDLEICFKEDYKLKCLGYQIKIPSSKLQNITFFYSINGNKIKINTKFVRFSRLNNYKASFYYDNKFLLTYDNNSKTIKVKKKPCLLKIIFKEMFYDLSIAVSLKKVSVSIVRLGYFFTKLFLKKDIWLISDRTFMAEDSGEVLFKYIMKNYPNKHNIYFVISKNCKDYERLKQFGKVIAYHSIKYKLYFLRSKYIISSHFDSYISNEFGKNRRFFSDLYRFKYVYLTHGILLHDSSRLLNKYNKHFAINVSTSNLEYNSISKEKYYYFDNEVKLTGMPRYDNLYGKNDIIENKILFMPSWRADIAGAVIRGTQNRLYNPKFVDSEYYEFYNKLLNDKKLLDLCKKKDYKIKFCLHPSLRAQISDFKSNDIVKYCVDCDSQYETRTSKMLVTDYSSAACDFAFLKKPVVYANFDYNDIFNRHYYKKGYFDYDKNGFGPNCINYEDTLKAIINLIENDCKNETKYIKRDEQFFKYFDSNNSKRIYDEIIKLDNKK